MVARVSVIETRAAPVALLLSLAQDANVGALSQFFQVSFVTLYRQEMVDHLVDFLEASGD
jgi:hypothetical protein